jgi:hypothetical protein
VLGPPRSGRRFVVVALLGVLAVIAGLVLAFRAWRARHDRLAAFGAREVAPAVLPLVDRPPPGFEPAEWGRVVGQVRRLVAGVTASGAIDRQKMERLRETLAARVASARPETSAVVLNGIWTDLEAWAGPALTRSPKFDLAATVGPLDRLEPPGVAPDDWALALVRTRAMLAAAAESPRLKGPDRRSLRDALGARTTIATSSKALEILAGVWDAVGDRLPAGFTRPEILPAGR